MEHGFDESGIAYLLFGDYCQPLVYEDRNIALLVENDLKQRQQLVNVKFTLNLRRTHSRIKEKYQIDIIGELVSKLIFF
jgi:hypothetical protein